MPGKRYVCVFVKSATKVSEKFEKELLPLDQKNNIEDHHTVNEQVFSISCYSTEVPVALKATPRMCLCLMLCVYWGKKTFWRLLFWKWIYFSTINISDSKVFTSETLRLAYKNTLGPRGVGLPWRMPEQTLASKAPSLLILVIGISLEVIEFLETFESLCGKTVMVSGGRLNSVTAGRAVDTAG